MTGVAHAEHVIVRWVHKPDDSVLAAIADEMDAQRGHTSPDRPAGAAAPTKAGPGPQTRLALEAIATMKGVRAAKDREAFAEQIADELERQSRSGHSLGGS